MVFKLYLKGLPTIRVLREQEPWTLTGFESISLYINTEWGLNSYIYHQISNSKSGLTLKLSGYYFKKGFNPVSVGLFYGFNSKK